MRNVKLVNNRGPGCEGHMRELRRKRCVSLLKVWRELLPQLTERGLYLHVNEDNCAFTLTGEHYGTI